MKLPNLFPVDESIPIHKELPHTEGTYCKVYDYEYLLFMSTSNARSKPMIAKPKFATYSDN